MLGASKMMKRFALLLLMAGTATAQITDFEKCQQRACYGYGPPSGTSQNGMIFQDLKETPPKLYCGQGGSWQICGSSGGTNVPATPNLRLYIQPLVGTVSAIGPASTSQNAVTPLLQGIGNADLYSTGNNGVSQFFAAFPTGIVTVPPTSASTEAWLVPPSGAAYTDLRNNSHALIERNNYTLGTTRSCSGGYYPSSDWSSCRQSFLDANADDHMVDYQYYAPRGPGYSLGPTGLPSVGLWSTRGHHLDLDNFFSRGNRHSHVNYLNCYGIGDCDSNRIYMSTRGGSTAQADEGNPAMYVFNAESGIYTGTLTSGSTGATLVTGTVGVFPSDGSYLLDTSRGTYDGTISSVQATFTPIAGGSRFMSATYTGLSAPFPVSTAWGISQAATNTAANGKFQIPVPQTIAFKMGDASPGLFTVGNNACVVGRWDVSDVNIGAGFTEQVPITNVGPVDGSGNYPVTFNTRYAYHSGALLMQGGMCGQYPTPTGTSQRTAVLALGAISPTEVIVTACTHGQCTGDGAGQENTIDLFIQTIYNPNHHSTFYPGAEIIGTQNGTPGVSQLATNTVPWTPGDTIINPNSASVNMAAIDLHMSQSTPENDLFSYVLSSIYEGPTFLDAANNFITKAPIKTMFKVEMQGAGSLQSVMHYRGGAFPSRAAFNFQDAPAGDECIFQGSSDDNYPRFCFYNTAKAWGFQNFASAYQAVLASNVPDVPTVLGQIPIATRITNNTINASDYTPTTVTGDGTLSSTGVLAIQKINGVVISGTPAVGYVPKATSTTTATWQPIGSNYGGVPTFALGAGAGALAGGTIQGTDAIHNFQVVTSGTPAASSVIATITLSAARPNGFPVCVFSPADAGAAGLYGPTQVFITATGLTTYTFTSGSTPLTTATTYTWNISCP